MKTSVNALLISLSLFITSSTGFCEKLKANKPVMLITSAEAAQPDLKISKGMFDSEEPNEGPIIEFSAPTPGTEVEKPVPIKIYFKQNQAPVDISTLEVTYLKLISIDITDRVKPFATAAGINIEEADLPSGSHKVKFAIRDTKDNLTEKTLKIKILEEEEDA